MLLYHGTSEKRGESILKDGLFQSHAKGNFEDFEIVTTSRGEIDISTTKGFVYLTIDIFKAYQYGYIATRSEREGDVYIFKLHVQDDLLLIDNDEIVNLGIRVNTIQESLDKFASVCVEGNIIVNKHHKLEYSVLPSRIGKLVSVSSVAHKVRVDGSNDFHRGYLKGSLEVLKALMLWKPYN